MFHQSTSRILISVIKTSLTDCANFSMSRFSRLHSITVVAVLFRASLSIIFRSVSQNYSHYLQIKVHIKAVNIFDTSVQKMFILRDLYLFILKMCDIWYEQKRAASLKVLFPLVWTFWLHLLWTINLPYYRLNCRTSINNFFELGTNWK